MVGEPENENWYDFTADGDSHYITLTPTNSQASSGYLIDGNGNVILFNGNAVYIGGNESTSNAINLANGYRLMKANTFTVSDNTTGSVITDAYIVVGDDEDMENGNWYGGIVLATKNGVPDMNMIVISDQETPQEFPNFSYYVTNVFDDSQNYSALIEGTL